MNIGMHATYLPYFGLAVAVSFLLMPVVIRVLLTSRVMDVPNRRSSHAVPVPRGGGFGILLTFAIIVGAALALGLLRFDPFALALFVGLGGLTVIGFIDDVLSLSAWIRLLFEGLLMAGVLALAPLGLGEIGLPCGPTLAVGAGGWLLAWLFLVGFPNLFNFMDGINGLAGFQTLVACSAFAVLAQMTGAQSVGVFAAVIAGGTIGFLRSNFPRARVFLGDSGSLPIGFFLAIVALRLAQPETGTPLVVPLLILWVFLFDAGLTLLIRTLRGRRLHHAHKDHLYQKLVGTGRSHAWVTCVYTAAMCGAAAAAFLYRSGSDLLRCLLLAALVACSSGLAALVLRSHRAWLRAGHRPPAP